MLYKFMLGGIDRVMFQGVLQVAFGNVHLGGDAGKDDVRRNSLPLGALPIGKVELLQRHLQGPVVSPVRAKQLLTKIHQGLNGTLAVGCRITDHDTATVILDGTGKNFARTRTELAGQDHQRSVPGRPTFFVGVLLNAAVGVLDLNDRATVDEQTGQVDRFGQATATVLAEVENHSIDVLLLEIIEDSTNVTSAAAEITLVLPGRFHVEIETGQIDVTNLSVPLESGSVCSITSPRAADSSSSIRARTIL